MNTTPRPIDIFLASIDRGDKLAAMIESVLATGYPARVNIAAGDPATLRTAARFGDRVRAVHDPELDRRPGCTAALTAVYSRLVTLDALFCTDDCVFDREALHVAVATLDRVFPDGDGVVGLAQANIEYGYPLAFPLMGRTFLDRFRGLPGPFWPGYYHLYNDVEVGLVAQCFGNWIFEPAAKLRHFHPTCGGGTEDATHHRGLARAEFDRSRYAERRAAGWLWGVDDAPADPPPPVAAASA